MSTISVATLRFLRSAVRAERSPAREAIQCTAISRPAFTTAKAFARPKSCANRRFYSSSSTSRAQAAQGSADATANVDSPSRAPKTYYELFPETLANGPPPSGGFSVDLKALRNEFLRLQAKAHPDLHSGENKRRAEATSALINEAYKTLQDPLRRAQYLLSLRGIETDKDEAAKLGGDAGGDSELLMEVMETNEMLEEAEAQEDIEPLKASNDARIADSIGRLEELFASQGLEDARKEAIRLRYWTNIKQSLHEWEPGKPTILVH